MKNKISFSLIFFIAMFFSSYASAGEFFTPPETDWLVVNIITPLFNPETSPFGVISGVFCGAVSVVGAILAGYTIVAGSMSTAHDGEALGKKWSTLWVPIRTALGMAFILPVKNGFCAVQIIVIWLAMQGIGLADKIHEAWLDSGGPVNSALYIQPALKFQLRQTFDSAVKNGTCLFAIQNAMDKTKLQSPSIFQGLFNRVQTGYYPFSSADGGKGYTLGIKSEDFAGSVSICGSIKLSLNEIDNASNNSSNMASTDNFIDLNTVSKAIDAVNLAQFTDLVEKTRYLGKKIADGTATPEEINKTFDEYYDNYVSTLRSQDSTIQSAINERAIEAMKEDGFVSLGAWSYRMAKSANDVNSAINKGPQAMANVNDLSGKLVSWFSDTVKNANDRATNLLSHAEDISGVGVGASGVMGDHNKLMDIIMNVLSPENLRPLMTSAVSDPVVLVANLGFFFLGAAQAVVVATVTFAVAGFLPLGTGVGVVAIINALLPVLLMVVPTLLMVGVMAAVYVPLMPFIILFGAVVGYLVLLIEALFAAPLWAMAHMSPDADGFVGKQGQGYMLILSLTLRPGLMVIGFVAARILLIPLAALVAHFWGFMTANLASGWTIIFSTYGSCIVYILIMNNLLKKLHALTHSLPDKILVWLSANASTVMGEYAQGIEGGTGSNMSMANNTMTNMAEKTGRSGSQAVAKFGKLAQSLRNNSGKSSGE